MRLNIQKRHIIGHNLGVVDEKFASHADDAKVGETVEIVGEDIRVFAAICQKITDALDAWLGGSPSPTIDQSSPPLVIKQKPQAPDDPRGLMELDLQLSLLARKVALWTAEGCTNGARDFVDSERMRAAFNEHNEAELREAIAELSTDDFVQSREFGPGLPAFRPTLSLYLTFDGIALGTDPIHDAVEIAQMALESDQGANANDLFTRTGWSLRRFNPIIEYIAQQVPDSRVSRTYGTGFTVNWIAFTDEDRVNIKRFIKRLQG